MALRGCLGVQRLPGSASLLGTAEPGSASLTLLSPGLAAVGTSDPNVGVQGVSIGREAVGQVLLGHGHCAAMSQAILTCLAQIRSEALGF